MHRDLFTGELDPSKPLSTEWGGPVPLVQGHGFPQPQHPAYTAPEGTLVTATANRWPSGLDDPAADPLAELPEWVEPTNAATAYIKGSWVKRNGAAYECITPGLTVAPEPASTVWRISPTPLWTGWQQPTDYTNAYRKDAVVLLDGKWYRSTYDGNDQRPGDPRYWVEVPEPQPVATGWAEPTPGIGSSLYEQGDTVLHEGRKWKSLKPLNAGNPGDGSWAEVT